MSARKSKINRPYSGLRSALMSNLCGQPESKINQLSWLQGIRQTALGAYPYDQSESMGPKRINQLDG
jgi:hypothetical protein